MASFYKMVLRGTCYSQAIRTIFYLGRTDFTEVEIDTSIFDTIRASWHNDINALWAATCSENYLVDSMAFSVVNERNEVISPYTYETAYASAGLLVGELTTVARAGVVGWKCADFTNQPAGVRVPKRSYILTAPIPETVITTDDNLTTTYRNALQSLANAVANWSLIVGSEAYTITSARIGVPSQLTDEPAAGHVVSGVARPKATFRRSRIETPSGT